MSDSNVQYKVDIKRGNRWTEFDTARFHISVGQEYHEGEKLRATFLWAGTRPSIKRVIVCVNDTLQRFNREMAGEAPALALDFSKAAGQSWIDRNKAAINLLPPHEIIRWDEWKADPRFSSLLSEMKDRYDQNGDFKAEVDQEVQAFWQRAQRRGGVGAGFEKFQHYSLQYLLEECAVFKLMFEKERAVDIYPGSTLLPCKLGPNNNLGARGFTAISFSRT